MKGKAACIMLALALVAAAGCTNLENMSLTPCGDEPGWVSRGSGEFGPAEESQIVGVGGAFPAKDKDTKALAEKQARKELTALVKSWTQSANDIMVGEMAKRFKKGPNAAETFFKGAAQGLAAAAAKKAEVRNQWSCGVTGEAFCRVALSEDALASMYMKQVAKIAQKKETAKALEVKPDTFVSALKKASLLKASASE